MGKEREREKERAFGGLGVQESADSAVVHGGLRSHLVRRFHHDSQLCG